jgi:diguanylate cyclase (GGDEF)-like protein
MTKLERLQFLVGLKQSDYDLISEYRETLEIELERRSQAYNHWFCEATGWSEEHPPFQSDYLESFIDGEYGEDFFAIQYQQASEWRRHDIEASLAAASLTQLRDIFISIGESLLDHKLARSLCRVLDLAQSIQAMVHHLGHVLERHQRVAEHAIARAERTYQRLSVEDQDGILNAYIEHYRWKLRAYRLALGEEPREIQLPLSHHDCTLGRWLDAGGMAQIPESKRHWLDSAHQRLHDLARMAVEDVQQHRPHAVTSYLLELESASDEITTILDETLNERLSQMAIRDRLTKLPNRRLFDHDFNSHVAMVRRTGSHLGLLVIDIDHFKKVNDEYGHTVGDELLHNLAARLAEALREADTIYRWGGEEFAALVWPGHPDELDLIAERLRSAVISAPFDTSAGIIGATVSIGAALFDRQSHIDTEALFRHADDNLREAKQQGRNRVIRR